ncbi:hypothetical protein C4E04_13820 [Microvirga sp. 17 mud 1-3]|nr:hypothetical protein C4E04_13820 [Microvirga sp. 17 mud 1-3]
MATQCTSESVNRPVLSQKAEIVCWPDCLTGRGILATRLSAIQQQPERRSWTTVTKATEAMRSRMGRLQLENMP